MFMRRRQREIHVKEILGWRRPLVRSSGTRPARASTQTGLSSRWRDFTMTDRTSWWQTRPPDDKWHFATTQKNSYWETRLYNDSHDPRETYDKTTLLPTQDLSSFYPYYLCEHIQTRTKVSPDHHYSSSWYGDNKCHDLYTFIHLDTAWMVKL